MKKLLLLLLTLCALGCGARMTEAPGQYSQAIGDCDAGSGGSSGSSGGGSGGETSGAGGTSGSAGASSPCDLSGYTVGTWRAVVAQPMTPMGVNGSDKRFTSALSLDPSAPHKLYSAVAGFNTANFSTVEGGLFRSEDCGATWAELGTFNQGTNVKISPDGTELYFGNGVRGGMGFWWSGNAGATFTKRSMAGTGSIQSYDDVYAIAVNPTNWAHVLVSFHSPGTSGASGVLESFDKGVTWIPHAPIAGTGSSHNVFFAYDIASSQGNASTWLMSTQQSNQGWWRTTNSGTSWSLVAPQQAPHAPVSLYYDSTGAVWASAYARGPLRSTDNGLTWTVSTSAGANNDWWAAVGGADGKVYSARWTNGATTLSSTTEASPNSWTPGPSIPGTTDDFAHDPTARMLYGSFAEGGIWARKY